MPHPSATDLRTDVTDDRGATLVEVLIAIVLMGTIVAATVAGLQIVLTASSAAFKGAEVDTVLQNAADVVDRATQSCDYDGDLAAAKPLEWGAEGSVTATVLNLKAPSPAGLTNTAADWTTVCPATLKPFDVQQVRIRVAHPDGETVRHLMVVKSSAT